MPDDARVQVKVQAVQVARAARAAADDRAVFGAPVDSFHILQNVAAGAGAIARRGAGEK